MLTRAVVLVIGLLAQIASGGVPATTLGRPASPAASPDAQGFLRRWLILEPIGVPGQLTDSAVRALVQKDYFPGQLTVLPKDGDTVTVGDDRLQWHAVETKAYNVNLFHFARGLNKPTSNVLFWAVTVVDVPRDSQGMRLAIGSNAASVWWIDGREVISLFNDRQTVIDDGVSRRVTLTAGPHVVRAAIVNAGGATDFCARFLDAQDRPVTDLRVRLDRGQPAPRP
jgi:hypothetical protein